MEMSRSSGRSESVRFPPSLTASEYTMKNDTDKQGKKGYTRDFYLDLKIGDSNYSAERVLSLVLPKLPPVSSVVDVGCGPGTWLATLLRLQRQKTEILGIDGPWVNRDLLVIPETSFLAVDISREQLPCIGRRYDLAISLEVAEHLFPEKAEGFVNFLTDISDFVLFSAAIPFQGGTNHFNERWQSYWADLFEQKGYIPLDLIRPFLWNDREVRIHYRQNSFLYVRKERLKEIKLPNIFDVQILSMSHPETHVKYARPSVKLAFKNLRESVKRSLVRRFGLRKNETPDFWSL